jgi:4-amino-4-deoxy-L-arabinose transferase-like glycosyltransferase
MRPGRGAAFFLLGFCLLLFSFGLGKRDFWSPDEPRYAGVARNLLRSGDAIVLTENGRPYPHKPPLYFWVLAISALSGGGLDEVTARIPSVLFACATVFLTWRLGSLLFQSRAGLLAALCLATCQRYFLEARWVHIDLLLTLLILVALTAAWRGLATGRGGSWALAYSAAGLGCLAKGPIALALPAAGLLTFLASARELSRLRETRWFWGLPLALLPVGAWLGAFAWRTGMQADEVVGTQVFRRLLEGLHHPRPVHYYLVSLPLEFLPWTLFLPAAFRVTFPGAERFPRRPLLFLYGWILGGFVLLSLVAEKRPSYLLPLFPPLALLVGLLWDDYLTRWSEEPLRRWIGIPVLLFAAVAATGLAFLPGRVAGYPGLRGRVAVLCLLLLLGAAAASVAIRLRQRGAALVALIAGTSAAYLWTAGSILPWLDPRKSARGFAGRIVERVGEAPLAVFRDYHPGIGYYTEREMTVLREAGQLRRFLAGEAGSACIFQQADFEKLRGVESLEELERAALGHRTYVLAVARRVGGEGT